MEINAITYYSAIVATLSFLVAGTLAMLRIREYLRDNKGIAVSYSWTGNPELPDFIYLINLSATPILVEHWELEWHEARFLKKNKISPIHIFDNEDLYLNLKPRERKALKFEGQYRFSWKPKNKQNARLFIKLHIAGRNKPLLLKVFPT